MSGQADKVLRATSSFSDFPAPTGDSSNIALGFAALR